MNKLKCVLLLLIVPTIVSCNKHDEVDPINELIGEWVRTDFSDDFEFTLNFYANNSGLKVVRTGNMNTQVVSSATQFDWSFENNTLKISEMDEVISTSYSINAEGQLILPNYSDLPFNRVN